ncbi:hypothetical protein A7U60_g1649 [Sanghuangporus baumii]|uniref:Zn(2)-C6 fungal-type domain-containing protein n=1 Tax=Sanghuangporus baumii TaxID=108892 RepID=A0A9Q5NEI4_SANBA|nr:hypothetical protein A7U60_g1649 [Sanghuangporus baumii]
MTSDLLYLIPQAIASYGAFSKEMPLTACLNVQQDLATHPQVRLQRRNMKACARCAGMHKKCNMFPPYSQSKCEECTKEGIAVCPPHKPRRSRRKRGRAYSDDPTSVPISVNKVSESTGSSTSVTHPASGTGGSSTMRSSNANTGNRPYSSDAFFNQIPLEGLLTMTFEEFNYWP